MQIQIENKIKKTKKKKVLSMEATKIYPIFLWPIQQFGFLISFISFEPYVNWFLYIQIWSMAE